jgi:DNA polymerase-1
MIQTLTGDVVDGYPGCPGVGIKTAEKLLSDCLSKEEFDAVKAWEIVVAQYEKNGLDEAYALSQAQVARICREEDYDSRNYRPIPWKPPKKKMIVAKN